MVDRESILQVQRYLLSSIAFWMDQFGIDGFRQSPPLASLEIFDGLSALQQVLGRCLHYLGRPRQARLDHQYNNHCNNYNYTTTTTTTTPPPPPPAAAAAAAAAATATTTAAATAATC